MKNLIDIKKLLLKLIAFMTMLIVYMGSIHFDYSHLMPIIIIPFFILFFIKSEAIIKILIPSLGMSFFVVNIYLSINHQNNLISNMLSLGGYIVLYYCYLKILNGIQLIEQSKKNERILSSSIYKIAEDFSQLQTENLSPILKHLCYYTGFEQISIYHLEYDKFSLVHHINLLNEKGHKDVITLTPEILEYCKNFKDLFIYDELGLNVFSNYIKENFASTSFVFVPVLSKNNEFIGFFLYEALSKEKRWEFEDFKILKIISNSYTYFMQRKDNEIMMEKSAKLSALGEISAGIAHEINNPLAIIHGQSSMMKILIDQSIKNSDPLDIDTIQSINELLLETVSRTDKIVNGLRYFIKNDDKNPFQMTDLESIMSPIQILSIDRCNKNNIDVQLDFSKIPESLQIECKPIQLSQVFINLINNAHDALISTKQAKKWIKIEACLDMNKKNIIFSVIDSGLGIPLEIGHKILEKFYTTKTHTKTSGSGLGLSISKRIIDLHHGELSIDYMCQNTKFDIKLPLTQPKD